MAERWAAPAGALGGIVGALLGMGGPPYVMYITGRIPDPTVQRATISQMVILNVGLRVAAFAVAGLLHSRAPWLAVVLLLPVAWTGVWLGNRVHGMVPPATMARLIGAVLFVTDAVRLVRTLEAGTRATAPPTSSRARSACRHAGPSRVARRRA
jgi:uncharacterized membrane protein YfcA